MKTEEKAKPRYWNGEGRFQEEYKELFAQLVPPEGHCQTSIGELLRATSKIYYDIYNNGGCNLDWPLLPFIGIVLSRCDSICEHAREIDHVIDYRAIKRFVRGKATDEQNDAIVDTVVSFVKSRTAKGLPNG
jgi:hypothetical protein